MWLDRETLLLFVLLLSKKKRVFILPEFQLFFFRVEQVLEVFLETVIVQYGILRNFHMNRKQNTKNEEIRFHLKIKSNNGFYKHTQHLGLPLRQPCHLSIFVV